MVHFMHRFTHWRTANRFVCHLCCIYYFVSLQPVAWLTRGRGANSPWQAKCKKRDSTS